ncbi:MAG: tetratricopeptide repeat protein [Pirellula sp.]
METTFDTLMVANQHFQRGQFDIAERLYRQVLTAEPQNADSFHFLALIAIQRGNHEEAIKNYRNAIAINPNEPAFHINLGNIFHSSGKPAEAVVCYRRALKLNPASVGANLNLGNALLGMRQFEDALACLRRVVELKQDSAEGFHSLGEAYRELGQLQFAIKSYRKAISLQPTNLQAHIGLGVALVSQNKVSEAVPCFRKAVEIAPNSVEALCNLALALKEQGSFEEVASVYESVLRIAPTHVEALSNYGIALRKLKRTDESVACLRRALDLRPDSVEVITNLGNSLRDNGNYQESLEYYERAIEIAPDFADAHCNLGIGWACLGEMERATESFERALAVKPEYPEAHYGMSFIHLLSGDWATGLPLYEMRWKTGSVPPRSFQQPMWDGTSLQGKTILLWSEQGLGDTIQFVRFASVVKQFGGQVIVLCQRQLEKCLEGCVGVDQWITDANNLPEFDVQCSLLSLPFVLKTRVETIPSSGPYLFANASLLQKWSKRMSNLTGFRVGLCWQGNRMFRDDRGRSFPLKSFEPLTSVAGVQLVSLQKGFGTEQLRDCPFSIVHYGSEVDELSGPFVDTAAIMKNLDLVVTVDSANAHLAGALGVPVWNLLTKVPHWPYLLDRTDTAWYPSMRLFRRKGDDQVQFFQELAIALQEYVNKGN